MTTAKLRLCVVIGFLGLAASGVAAAVVPRYLVSADFYGGILPVVSDVQFATAGFATKKSILSGMAAV